MEGMMNRNTVSIRPRSTIHHHNNNGLQHHMNHPPSPPTTRLVSPLSIRSVLAIPTTTTTTVEIFPTSTLPIEVDTEGIRNPPPLTHPTIGSAIVGTTYTIGTELL